MKKVLLLLTFSAFLFFTSCFQNQNCPVSNGAKVIAKCCNTIKSKSCSLANPIMQSEAEDGNLEAKNSSDEILPGYGWDSKMMIW